MKGGRAHKPVHMTSREVFSDIDIENGNKVTVLLIREKIKYGDLEGEKKRERLKILTGYNNNSVQIIEEETKINQCTCVM